MQDTTEPKTIFASKIPAIITSFEGKTSNITNKNNPTKKQLAMKDDNAKY